MSSLAVGGLVPVAGPLPRPRNQTLLTVPGVRVPQDQLESHWQGGVSIWQHQDVLPELWEGCSEGTFRTKDEGEPGYTEDFVSFILYVAIRCTAAGIGSYASFTTRVRRIMEATEAFGVERALAQGVVGLDNPYMGDSNLVNLGGPVSAGVGISYLEEALSEWGRGGLIHLTPAVTTALTALPLDEEGPSSPMYTAAGTPIAIGAGYNDTDPAALATPGTTQDWIFATGPVEVRLNDEVDVVPEDIASALDRSDNDLVVRAEKVAVVSWDTSLQAAVLVDWTM